jgi:signal transduction histidine kinase
VLLLGGANEIARLLVLVTLAAMASAASTTLASIPRAAQGYIAGALLVPAARWLLLGDVEYVVFALLAVSMALFLVLNARITHEAFLESIGRAREIERLTTQFHEERAEWLEWSHATEAFALLGPDRELLIWNSRFQELLAPTRLERGADYVAALAAARLVPESLEGAPVTAAEWQASRRAQLEVPGEQLEAYPGDVFYQVSTQHLPSGRRIVTAINVTALKRTERALREQDHALAQSQRQESVGVIAGGVAHDFNNLLTAIQGATELLLAESPEAASRTLLDDIRASVERGARLTRQLLAYGRLQSLDPRVLDLNHELEKSLPLFRRLLPASVRIDTTLGQQLHPVSADPEQLSQVMMNLVLNARDAMPRGGVLSLSTSNVGDLYVQLSVADDGVGMSKETVERIFEPFFSTKDQQRGSGLGLSAVQGIVRQSGGHVLVESDLGAGTRMCVRLPRCDAVATATPPPSVRTEPPPGNNEQVLVVDDEELVRRLTARLLRRQGYDVIEADGPLAALALLESSTRHTALLVTDVVMPEMSGVDLAARARKLHPDLAVVFMSGYEPGLMDPATARQVLQKPFTPPQLVRAVNAALADVQKKVAKGGAQS